MRMLLLVAWRNLRQGGRRTLLLGLALAMVTGLLVFLLALSRGVNVSMTRAATTLSSGHVNVAGFYKATPDDVAPLIQGVDALRRIATENTEGLVRVLDRHRGWCKVISETSSMWVGLHGIEVSEEDALFEQLTMAAPATYVKDDPAKARPSEPRRLSEPGTIMLFRSQADRLGVQVGDQVTLRTETLRGQSNTADLTVVAVADDLGLMSTWAAFVPKDAVRSLYGLKADTSGAVYLYLDDIDRAPAVMAHLREVLTEAGYTVMDHDPQPFFMKFETVMGQDWTGQKLDLTIWRDEVSFLTWVLTAIDSVSFLLTGILAVLIAIGIMNALYIAVRERTGEVGTLRAIGMGRRRVLALFVIEAMLLGLVATSIGAALSATVALIIDAVGVPLPWTAARAIFMNDHLSLVVAPAHLIGAVAAFTIITGFSAFWPALRAARLPPITAIHQTE
ncbi:MAG: ABC transporter permease [Myxococcales bacterium]|nr:ABC transporter permease [Myxococcales bacterium]